MFSGWGGRTPAETGSEMWSFPGSFRMVAETLRASLVLVFVAVDLYILQMEMCIRAVELLEIS